MEADAPVARGRPGPSAVQEKEHVERMGMPTVFVFTSIARPLHALGLRLRYATPAQDGGQAENGGRWESLYLVTA